MSNVSEENKDHPNEKEKEQKKTGRLLTELFIHHVHEDADQFIDGSVEVDRTHVFFHGEGKVKRPEKEGERFSEFVSYPESLPEHGGPAAGRRPSRDGGASPRRSQAFVAAPVRQTNH